MKTSFRKYLSLFVALISILATSCSDNKTSNQKAAETDTLENVVSDSIKQIEHIDSASNESNFGLDYKSEYWAENPQIYWQGSSRTYISDVLNSSNLNDGDTIFFPRGIYTERLTLENKKGLYLVAKDGPAYF
ncbi:MAG: hypothetical protein KDC92_07125 [Bacteroidetes bacterium]|nr:hypothetical protein [Bacteroidota bacterium]